MEQIIINGLVLFEGEFKHKTILLKNGKITDLVAPSEDFSSKNKIVYDAKENYIVPGFIDIHTHGAVGEDVNNTTPAGLEKISRFFAKQGTTSWLASLLTDSEKNIEESIEQVVTHQSDLRNTGNLLGVHLEGPFLSYEYKGSMPESFLTNYNGKLIKKYQKIANGSIRYMTVAPEVSGVLDHISEIIDMGIQVAIGHSAATYKDTIKAIDHGARASTHTFNAMRLFHQHEPAIMGGVLESDVFCEAICDGLHLHPASIRLLLKCKGLKRVVMITDSIMATGLRDGNYKLGVNDIVVTNGDAKLEDKDVRAGSTLTMQNALKNMLKFTDLSLSEIIPLMSQNPAKLLKIDHLVGTIGVGKLANLVVLDDEYNVVETFIKGKSQLKETKK